MLKGIRILWYRFVSLFDSSDRYRWVNDIEEKPESGVYKGCFVIVKAGATPKWLYMQCPCGCGQELQLPLMKNLPQYWVLTIDERQHITVSPSIHVKSSICCSHFWIRNNKIVWAEPKPQR